MLTEIVNRVWNEGDDNLLKDLKTVIVINTNGDTRESSNYRVIRSILSKVYEIIIKTQTYNRTKMKRCFSKGRSTQSHVFTD